MNEWMDGWMDGSDIAMQNKRNKSIIINNMIIQTK